MMCRQMTLIMIIMTTAPMVTLAKHVKNTILRRIQQFKEEDLTQLK